MAGRYAKEKYPRNLIGLKFGKLSVIGKGESYRSPKGSTASMWWCQCDCGSEPILLRRDSLTTGNTRSCGCLYKDTVVIHNGTGTRLYQTWRNMVNRCYRKDMDSYHLYGAKGIGVCKEWRNDFNAFRKWAYENGYNDNLTIERNDSSKDYSPENCRWATPKEQSRNTSRNHILSYNGYSYPICVWAEKMNMNQGTVRYYAYEYGDKEAIPHILSTYAKAHDDFIYTKELKAELYANPKNNSNSNQD